MAQPDVSPRDQIAAEIPSLIEDAIAVFRRMAVVTVPMEPKGFAAYLRATNALLDHIDGLVRLKEWTEVEPVTKPKRGTRTSSPAAAEKPELLLEAARRALGGKESAKA